MVGQQSTGTTPIKVQGNDGKGGGLLAKSGTEFTWSPQLWNLAEWNWLTIFLQSQYGRGSSHGRTMSFCSVLSFLASKHQEKVSWTFSMEVLNIRRRDVWTVHGWLHLSWFGISGSSVKLIEIFCLIIGRTWIFQRPACSISYRFSIYNGIKTLFLILNICYEHTMIVWFLQKSYVNVR